MSIPLIEENSNKDSSGKNDQLLSRGTFIHNKVLAKAQFELFLSIYNTCRGRE